jgi:DNA-directed RNA polymerase subunit RPC12/RpoP
MKCPGQDMQFWENDAIYEVKCPECNKMVEFYKDDTTRKCHHCSHRFVNPKMDFGCATYCQFAEQCLGTLPEEFVLQQDNLLKDKVAVAVKRYFKTDFKSIRLTAQMAGHAEKIGKSIEGANLALILCSSYLLLISNPSIADLKPVDFDQPFNDVQTEVPIQILKSVGANDQLIDQVCDIISNKMSGAVDDQTAAHSVVFDACRLALLESEHKDSCLSPEDKEIGIMGLNSDTARDEARKILQS